MAPTTIAVLNGTSRVNRHIIQQALQKGHRVRAIVRSSSRFYAQTKKHDDLEAHEWADFTDLTALASILKDVDVIYIALCAPGSAIHKPSSLNTDAVQSICTVLHDRITPGSRSATKLILLSAHATVPGQPRIWASEAILGQQFNDLRAAQTYLLKQHGWLDVAYVAPGLILDSESSEDAAATDAVKLQEGGQAHDTISYARLANAMQMAADDPQWTGRFILPVPTTKVTSGVKYLGGPGEVILTALKNKLIPYLGKTMALVMVGSAVGYVVGSRDGGSWVLRTFGINVRSM